MRLTILNGAYLFAPVELDGVGGAEQVVAQFDTAILSAGHNVIVIPS